MSGTEIGRFLDALERKPNDRLSVLFHSPHETRQYVRCASEVEELITKNVAVTPSIGVYIGAQLFNEAQGRTAEDVTALTCLFADLDDKNAPREQLWELVRTLATYLEAEPTVVVDTGHGIQPYWSLEAPLMIRDNDSRAEARQLLTRWGLFAQRIAGDIALDNVFDLARVLRCPNTLNAKEFPTVASGIAEQRGGVVSINSVNAMFEGYGLDAKNAPTSQHGTPASARGVAAFADAHAEVQPGEGKLIAGLKTIAATSTSRHDGMVQALALACDEMAAGLTSSAALGAVREVFAGRLHGERPIDPEFSAAVAWCVSSALLKTADQLDEIRRKHFDRDEFQDVMPSGWQNKAPRSTMVDQNGEVDTGARPVVEVTSSINADDAFWQSREIFRKVSQAARASRTSPHAVLLWCVARVLSCTPATVDLPGIVGGGTSSLNLIVAIVGRSGLGKGVARRASFAAFDTGKYGASTFPIGSGEGVAKVYKSYRPPKAAREGVPATSGEVVWNRDEDGREVKSALLYSDEIASIATEKSRSGSLMSTLRRGFSGESLGGFYSQAENRIVVGADTYRLVFVMSIQPKMAQILFDGDAAGDPQRVVFGDAADPSMPRGWENRPEYPTPFLWEGLPDDDRTGVEAEVTISVCDLAIHEIDDAHTDKHHGHGNELDTHGLLVRLKVGAALALFESRTDVTEDDWTAAGILMAHSNRVRDGMLATLASITRTANTRRGALEGERDVLRAATVAKSSVQNAARRIRTILGANDDWRSRSDLRSSAGHAHRGALDEAIDLLVHGGDIERREVGKGTKYRLTR